MSSIKLSSELVCKVQREEQIKLGITIKDSGSKDVTGTGNVEAKIENIR